MGVSLALVCMAGMGIFRYKAVKQLEKYQAIADAYAQLDTILEEGREKAQQEVKEELQEMIAEMEADAEHYQQEYEAEMREKGRKPTMGIRYAVRMRISKAGSVFPTL